mmetsp:Transcript_5143/g.9235  ORF Transcript_5143/g.9235 Transcript_5143/m.9235 type:complete len:421 (+) Transcript_5143:2653-3915(+)|eukprot:CAMPEP_0184514026 /NCGR_PEP_ID=MMETSP0198_2-20121128/3741_1 /TAXON_ID=1112570 /ORGANISM="Thraustochytrium sp., Strain LLF1b" /LENGTH=420 /DNA_ID=CAMNT_0026904183 /DNA_START=123 /DNA_END=1385 /DNA_ORIENTATION=-
MGEGDEFKFGCKLPFSEPSWYDSRNDSPYYTEAHKVFRGQMREFVDNYVIPNVEKWEKDGIPREAFQKAAKVGLIPTILGWPEDCVSTPRPEGFDGLFLVIAFDELCRCASGGIVWGLVGGLGIGAPPVAHYGTDEMRQRVLRPCLDGDANIALAVSEATAGSDVGNLSTTAEEQGDFYIVNGLKKWITCSMFADYFTVAARTGGKGSGMMGISLILVERSMPGVTVREMDCMGAKGSGTGFVEFDDVKVPKANYIGDVTCLLRNFITERLGIALQANRFARECLKESIEYAKRRKAFGKKLEDQPVVRAKIANMALRVESTHALIESLAFRIVAQERRGEDWFDAILRIGAEAGLAKVAATDTFEFCAREAAMIHGGNSYVKGNKIESLYRHVLSLSIPGGSSDVILDASARLALKGML